MTPRIKYDELLFILINLLLLLFLLFVPAFSKSLLEPLENEPSFFIALLFLAVGPPVAIWQAFSRRPGGKIGGFMIFYTIIIIFFSAWFAGAGALADKRRLGWQAWPLILNYLFVLWQGIMILRRKFAFDYQFQAGRTETLADATLVIAAFFLLRPRFSSMLNLFIAMTTIILIIHQVSRYVRMRTAAAQTT